MKSLFQLLIALIFGLSNQVVVSKPVSTLPSIPFTVQAPLGEWSNPVFQDGCEESAALMLQCAVGSIQCSVTNGVIDKNWATKKIIEMSGEFADTSAEDTAKKFLTNVQYQIVNLKSKQELKNGIWIIPMNGQKLHNPYYTAPGPERHMVLVTSYDPKTDELITNDPGTKHGKGYRYKLEVFWQAIRDYPTGNHERITGEIKRGIKLTELATK